MAGCYSKFSDQRFRNWIKASYAGNIAKEGCEDIVFNTIVKFHRDILADILAEEKLEDGARCSECKTENILRCPTRDVCVIKSGCCAFHNGRRNQYRVCPNSICDGLREQIKKSHKFNNPSFKNTRADAWCTNPIEIAKCYLPRDGYVSVNSITEMDLNGVLNVMTNHQAFQDIVDQNACFLAKELGKQFRHSPDLLIENNDLNEYLNNLITLLTSTNQIKNDKKAAEAVQKIQKLQAETLSISTNDVTELLQRCIQEMTRCSLRNIEEKTKQCMEEALNEIRASVTTGVADFPEAANQGVKRKCVSTHTENIEVKRVNTPSPAETKDKVQQYPAHFMSSACECFTRELYEELRESFVEDLLTFNSRRHATIQLSPLLEKYDAALLDFYVFPDMNSVELKKSELGGSEIKYPVISLQGLFRKQNTACKEIYLTADGGLGKTAFSKYLTLVWCRAHSKLECSHGILSDDNVSVMKEFDLVFLILLRESRDDCDIDNMIFNLIVKRLSRSYKYSLAFLQEALHREKCLVILDGLDEWTHPENPSCQTTPKCVPHRNARERCTIVSTSRPWKLSTICVSKSQIHHLVEMVGLSRKARDVLKCRTVSKVKHDGNDQLGGDIVDFDYEIKMNEIGDLETVPMLLMYLVCLWCDGKPLGRSKCVLFSNIVDLKLSRNSQRLEMLHLTKLAEKLETSDGGTFIPPCFASKPNCKQYFNALKAIGKLAFSTLFSASGETTLVFDISVAMACMSEQYLKFSLSSGILTQTEVQGSLTSERSNVSFTHKTFQEYFAALHIASTSEKDAMLKLVLSTCSSIQRILELSNVFIFLSGLKPRRSELISIKLAEVIARDDVTCKYRRTESFWDYYSVEEPLKRIQDLEISCIKEHGMNFEGALNLRLEDFIIDRNCQQQSYASALEALAVTNARGMKSLNIELEGISSLSYIMDMFKLNNVRGIEHILLRGECTDIDIVNLLSKSVDTLKSVAVISRQWQCNHFEGQLCMWTSRLGQALNAMSSRLEAIHLNGFLIGHDHLKELVSYLTRRNSMKEIILGNIHCADHLDECSGFKLELSSHSFLRTLRLHNLPLSQLKINVSSLEQVSIGQLPYRQTSVLTSYLRCLPAAKKLERFRCSFLESALDVEEVLKTLPTLVHLKDLRLHSINLGDRALTISNEMTEIEFVHLSEVTMSSSALQKLLKTLMGYRQSVMIVLVNCDLGTDQDWEMIRKSIRSNDKLMVLFDGANQWNNDEFSFRTVNESID